VLAFDPMGQGERHEYSFPYPAYEHSYAGAQLFMAGHTLARDFIWDGIRAIDYLCTRKEVDTSRIGITGRSGGGTQTAFIAAFDGRIKAEAPENYITSMKRLFQAMGPQDAEQDFLYGIARGLDMADLLEVRAPKPCLVVATTQDMFPIQGTMETAAEVARIYRAYGASSNFSMVTDDAPHASTLKNREATYAFFQRVFHVSGSPAEVSVVLPGAEELRVTRTGRVGGKRAFELNAAEGLRPAGSVFRGILEAARELSGYREPRRYSAPWFVGRAQRAGYVIEKYLLKGEGDYMMPYIIMRPSVFSGKAMLYLNPAGKAADMSDMEWFVRSGVMVVAPDLVGFGELGPGEFKGDSYIDSVSYNLWFAAMLIHRSIVGIQAGDVVRLVNELKREGVLYVYGLAMGGLAPVLLHAAAFDTAIGKVALIGSCPSYRALVMDSAYKAAYLYSTVPGAVGVYDLPDLETSLAPRALLITDGADPNALKQWIEK
jgi:hypothetical protein